jgi:hypothetical protein
MHPSIDDVREYFEWRRQNFFASLFPFFSALRARQVASVLLLKYLDLSGGIGYPGSAYAKTGRRVECNCSG